MSLTYLYWAQCYRTFYDRNLIIFKLSWSVCYNRLKKLVMDKPSSLLRKFVNYDCKKFSDIVTKSVTSFCFHFHSLGTFSFGPATAASAASSSAVFFGTILGADRRVISSVVNVTNFLPSALSGVILGWQFLLMRSTPTCLFGIVNCKKKFYDNNNSC